MNVRRNARSHNFGPPHSEDALPVQAMPSRPVHSWVLSPVFTSHDLDETRHSVARIFKPHDLAVYGVKQTLNAHMDHLALGGVSINRLCYGANVVIEPDCLEDFLLVQMPIAGRAEIRCGTHFVKSHPLKASVLTPSLPLHMRWEGACDQLIVRIDRKVLEDACSARLGYALPRAMEFELGMPLDSGAGHAWKALIEFLAVSPFLQSARTSELILAHIEQLLVDTLLDQHPHNFSDTLRAPVEAAPVAYVQRAQDYILAHSHQPITMQTLAEQAAISARSLYNGFRQHRGISPMAFLRLVRLQKVRDQLLQARGEGRRPSITQIALDCGFMHLGHFSQAYRRQYNETPTETLMG